MDVRSPSELVLPSLVQAGGELSPEAIAALIAHPRFPDAMRAMLTTAVGLFKGNRILNHVGFDRGRVVTAILALASTLSIIRLLGHVVSVPTVAPTLATMIGLGVGID